jgi:hypothetical protein
MMKHDFSKNISFQGVFTCANCAATQAHQESVCPLDVVKMAIQLATRSFSTEGRTFNGAGFSNAFKHTSGVNQTLDGGVVRALLSARKDVVFDNLSGYYSYIGDWDTQELVKTKESVKVSRFDLLS